MPDAWATVDALIREVVDRYLAASPATQDALDATFGGLPSLELPSRLEWSRG